MHALGVERPPVMRHVVVGVRERPAQARELQRARARRGSRARSARAPRVGGCLGSHSRSAPLACAGGRTVGTAARPPGHRAGAEATTCQVDASRTVQPALTPRCPLMRVLLPRKSAMVDAALVAHLDVVHAVAPDLRVLARGRGQHVALVRGRQELDRAAVGDRVRVVAVAGERERAVGQREHEAAMADRVAVDHVGAHGHGELGLRRAHAHDAHAEACEARSRENIACATRSASACGSGGSVHGSLVRRQPRLWHARRATRRRAIARVAVMRGEVAQHRARRARGRSRPPTRAGPRG